MSLKLYCKPSCGRCKPVREFLSAKGLEYEYHEVVTKEDLTRFINETGMMGLPVLTIDGRPVMIGNVYDLKAALSEGKI